MRETSTTYTHILQEYIVVKRFRLYKKSSCDLDTKIARDFDQTQIETGNLEMQVEAELKSLACYLYSMHTRAMQTAQKWLLKKSGCQNHAVKIELIPVIDKFAANPSFPALEILLSQISEP